MTFGLRRVFELHFEWDPIKAAGNRSRHRISFELAATVFRDPLTASVPDEEHNETEERWITLGQADNGRLLVVVHTHREIGPHRGQCAYHLRAARHQARTTSIRGRHMKQEYDFSKGERGKFFRENARFDLPVYLDEDVQRHLQERARSKGMEVARLVNEMLRQDIERIEAVK